jgi:hypothetical protein
MRQYSLLTEYETAIMADITDAQPTDPSDTTKSPVPPTEDARRERPTPEGDGLDPTRYGDWEKNGRCIDF